MAEPLKSSRPRLREMERGRFRDRDGEFVVCTSASDAPDSFRVYQSDKRSELVLVITGVTTGELKASWGRDWREQPEEWREWMEAQAFMAFYSVARPPQSKRYVGRVRVCNG